jgi:hypothetical protein
MKKPNRLAALAMIISKSLVQRPDRFYAVADIK